LDPLYRRLVEPRRWLNHALLGFSFFAALNVALPLVGMRPILALEASAVLSALALAPAFRRQGRAGWIRAHAMAVAAAFVAIFLIWFARGLVPAAPLLRPLAGAGWIRAHAMAVAAAFVAIFLIWFARGLVPPAPLFLARAVVARDVAELEPVDPAEHQLLSSSTVREWGQLAAYTAVYAPAGVRQVIRHVWWRDRVMLAHVPLPTPVQGGRLQGFRRFLCRTHCAPRRCRAAGCRASAPPRATAISSRPSRATTAWTCSPRRVS